MSAARRSSSTTRRTLLTATAAGTVLGALWFVPSANGTPETPDTPRTSAQQALTVTDTTPRTELADTGASVNTTPYLVGGTLSLCLGAGFVTYSVRRARRDADR